MKNKRDSDFFNIIKDTNLRNFVKAYIKMWVYLAALLFITAIIVTIIISAVRH